MAWYIDAVAELDELHARHCASCNAFSGEDCKQCKIGHIVDFLENKYLDDAQTADVAEVKHGEWMWETEDRYECSNCGVEQRVDEVMGLPTYNYCPYCGAKMDGGQTE